MLTLCWVVLQESQSPQLVCNREQGEFWLLLILWNIFLRSKSTKYLWNHKVVCVWYSQVGPVKYWPSLPRRKSSAVLLNRMYVDHDTHDRDRRWKTTEHRIFLHSPLVMWSLSHWGRGTHEQRGRRETLRNDGHAEGGENGSFTDASVKMCHYHHLF